MESVYSKHGHVRMHDCSFSSNKGSSNSLEYLQEDKESGLGRIKVDLMRTRPVRTTFSEGQG